jgi:peptidyl-prolyl cis-trans isomerase SurA
MKADLEDKISKDERSRLVTASLTEKLKTKYVVKRDEAIYAKVKNAVTNDFYESKWIAPSTPDYAVNLVTIDNKITSAIDFLAFVKTQERAANTIKPVNKMVDKLYANFVEEKLNTTYNDNLENEFPEFNNVMEEYRDGLLLFDLMEKEIWEKSKTDTIGLKKFYDINKGRYNWKTRLDMTVCSSTSEETIKKALKMLKEDKKVDEIKTALNTKEVVNIMSSNGVYEEGNNNIPKGTKMQVGVSEITKNGEYYFVTKINKLLQPGTKTLEECKGKAINDYQQYLEENWVSNLKKEYTVKVNNDVFEKIKKEIKSKK